MDPALLQSEEYRKMVQGQLYFPSAPELAAARDVSARACKLFNAESHVSRRRQVELWKSILRDKTPLPPVASSSTEDDALFDGYPFIDPPVFVDYGVNTTVGPKTYLNRNLAILDTCKVTIGSRVLIGPNVSIFTAAHPIDPAVRNGCDGPEYGKEIVIEDDCWIGGNVTICPGVKIGKGSTVGAGSVVTKAVAPYTVVGGCPARVIKTLPTPSGERSSVSR